jgi:hypothetical protein
MQPELLGDRVTQKVCDKPSPDRIGHFRPISVDCNNRIRRGIQFKVDLRKKRRIREEMRKVAWVSSTG